ncbi:MAG: DNA helicase II [Pseudomonadota bacterium]|nr:DNA helicase II [Pseudomonadota bacterium]
MHFSPLTDDLNKEQVSVVTAPHRNLLVIAGAGSGKTRVLVHRIAWLIQEQGLSPHEILAVTFTNKASREMRGRIEGLLGIPIHTMWVGTFHGLAHRMLRQHFEAARLPEGFQIMDSDDQLRLIKRLHKQLNLDETNWPPKQSQWYINNHKDAGNRTSAVYSDGSLFDETMLRMYQTYEAHCQRAGLLDFAELLLRTYELLQNNPLILTHYHDRFRYVLVDEFQDTNALQYAWLKLITSPQSKIMIVGDDDQSIYSWRGALVGNIQRFCTDFADTDTIRLEQNYRSTKTILAAANAVISNNANRLGKELWTSGDEGDPISIYSAFNEIDEARFVVSAIEEWTATGKPNSSAAILYRSNAQSRVLEEELLRAGIPYRIYGGQKFFDRAEIKDALAYLRLIANRNDDGAFERVVNVPTRGIGNTTLNALRDQAKQFDISLWDAAEMLIRDQHLAGRALNAIGQFLNLINNIATETEGYQLANQTEFVLTHSKLIEFYGKDNNESSQSRVENLQELVQATKVYSPMNNDDSNLSALQTFLAHVALEAGENQADIYEDSVQLMTLHSAKGLEFELVIICGVEEGLFPHHMSNEDPNRLEEERRLCYVGMTRAKQKLLITYAESRRMYGRENFPRPSRYLLEIPTQYIQEVRPKSKISRPVSFTPNYAPTTIHAPSSIGDTGLKIGQRVQHKKFGEGTILNFEGSGDNTQIQVKFATTGTKWLMPSIAKLEVIA